MKKWWPMELMKSRYRTADSIKKQEQPDVKA